MHKIVNLCGVMFGIFCCMNLYSSQMSSSSSLSASATMPSLIDRTVGAVNQGKLAKDEQQEMQELEVLYKQIVKKQEQEEKLKEEAEQAALLVVAAVKELIVKIEDTNPKNEGEQAALDTEADNLIHQAKDPLVREKLAEQLRPALDRLHKRLSAYLPLGARWDDLLKRARANENDQTIPAAVEALKKETEAIGYHLTARVRAEEILHPWLHRLARYVHKLADFFQELQQFTPSVAAV